MPSGLLMLLLLLLRLPEKFNNNETRVCDDDLYYKYVILCDAARKSRLVSSLSVSKFKITHTLVTMIY
jgi:hypothetical protein